MPYDAQSNSFPRPPLPLAYLGWHEFDLSLKCALTHAAFSPWRFLHESGYTRVCLSGREGRERGGGGGLDDGSFSLRANRRSGVTTCIDDEGWRTALTSIATHRAARAWHLSRARAHSDKHRREDGVAVGRAGPAGKDMNARTRARASAGPPPNSPCFR